MLYDVSSRRHMQRKAGCAVVRQAWLIYVVGVFLIGFALFPLVGCSGDTGSQPSGSQDSEVSQSEQTGSERSASRESESTVAGSQPSGSQDGETTREVAQHGGSQASEGGDSTHDGVLQGKSIENVPNYSDSFLPKIDGITYDFLDYSGELKDE